MNRIRGLLLSTCILAAFTALAAPTVVWPPDNMAKTQVKRPYQPAWNFGYAPGRDLPDDSAWIPHVGGAHSSEFELRPDCVRATVGYGSGFMRSFISGLDDFPGAGKPGRIVLRMRRDRANLPQHVKMMVVSNDRHWEWRIEKDVVFDWFRKDDKDSKDNRMAWPNEQWDSWHDYVVTFTGDSASVSIDNDPARTMPLKIEKGEGRVGAFYVSIGGTMDWVEIQSIRFTGMNEPAIVPEPKVAVSGGRFTRKYANGKTCVETVFSGGVENGPFLCRWPDDKKRCEGRYEKGIKQGLWTYWYPNGQTSWEQPYKDGARDGKVIQWSFDGTNGRTIEYKAGRRGATVQWEGSPYTTAIPAPAPAVPAPAPR